MSSDSVKDGGAVVRAPVLIQVLLRGAVLVHGAVLPAAQGALNLVLALLRRSPVLEDGGVVLESPVLKQVPAQKEVPVPVPVPVQSLNRLTTPIGKTSCDMHLSRIFHVDAWLWSAH